MKRLKMTATEAITFEEECNKYLDKCRGRNLREGRSKSTGDNYYFCFFTAYFFIENCSKLEK